MLRRALSAVAVGCATGATASALVPPPASAAGGACPAGSGVTVVVDYGPLGGGVRTACDEDGGGRTATAVMAATGFDLDYVQTQPGFVCRIEGRPAPSDDDCVRTPPQDAYWGLFWSDGDSGWNYSSIGVAGLDLPDGASLGWRFQDGGAREEPGAGPTGASSGSGGGGPTPTSQPTTSPQPTRSPEPSDSPEPTKAPEPSRTQDPTPAPTQPPSRAAKPSGTPEARASRPGQDRTGHRPAEQKGGERPVREPRPSTSPRGDGAASTRASATADTEGSDGSGAALTLAAAGALLLLAGAVGVLARRRRP